MAVTQAEVINLFNQVSAIKNSDQLLMLKANQDGTVSTVKLTAELLRAYLSAGLSVAIGDDGYFYIGGVKTSQYASARPTIVMVDESGPSFSISLLPNRLYVWDHEVTAINANLHYTEGTDEVVNEFMLQFTTATEDFTLHITPDGNYDIVWLEEPEWQAHWTYQISIVNNLAVCAGWDASRQVSYPGIISNGSIEIEPEESL